MKEYQLKSDKSRVLPTAVYHQCIWLVRDMPRMKEIVYDHEYGTTLAESGIVDSSLALKPVREIEAAAARLEAIRKALLVVPEEYREGVLTSVIVRGGFLDTANINTWKKWKQVFIYELARKLNFL